MKQVIIGLWLLLGVAYWGIAKYACNDGTKANVANTEVGAPFQFDSKSGEINTFAAFNQYADSIKTSLGPKDKLSLIGLLSKDEAESNPKLGIERAQALQKLLDIESDRVMVESRVVEELPSDLRYVEVKRLSGESAIVEREVADTGDINQHSTIYFPFNSTDKLDDARVEKFLNGIAQRVKGSGERVLLVGHTDKIGTRRYNYNLGDRRAKSIKYYLISRGVLPQKIITQSQGELNQADNSDSAYNLNRRTEVKLLR